MLNSILNIQVIEPENSDNWITNGETFSKMVYLGINDSIDNWTEITNEEKEAKEKEMLKENIEEQQEENKIFIEEME